jgi:hypothetical protein
MQIIHFTLCAVFFEDLDLGSLDLRGFMYDKLSISAEVIYFNKAN